MAVVSVYEGIIFIEGTHPLAQIVGPVNVDLGFKIGAQLKTLNDVKKEMNIYARNAQCNCIVNFKYGQKSKLLAIDDVAYYGSGQLAVLPLANYKDIIGKLM